MAVILNNAIDALVPGHISYADLVPTVTVNTFIKGVESQFGCKLFIDYNRRTVHIIHLNSIFSTSRSATKDFTSKLSSPVILGYDDPAKLVLTVGKSFSRSVVIGDSEAQVMDETDARSIFHRYEDALFATSAFVRHVVYAVNRNNFYVAEPESGSPDYQYFREKFLCSPFFDYRGDGNLSEQPVEINAEAVNIICALDKSTDYWHIDVPFFEADIRRLHPISENNSIPLVDGYGNSNCPLSFVIVRSWVTANYLVLTSAGGGVNVRYLFASAFTTHPVAAMEEPGSNHRMNLTPVAIRDLWYREFENFLSRSNITASCGIAFDGVDINNLKWWEKIWIQGQPYFIDKINLTLIGDSDIRVDSVDLRTARLYGFPPPQGYVFTASPRYARGKGGSAHDIDIISTFDGNPTDWEVVSISYPWVAVSGVNTPILSVSIGLGIPAAANIVIRQINSSEPNITIEVYRSG
jgi:hypothetical protein